MKKKCEYCGKVIESLYVKQLDYNFDAHQLTCKEKHKGELHPDKKGDASFSKRKRMGK